MNGDLFACNVLSPDDCGLIPGKLCRCTKEVDHQGNHYCDLCGKSFVPLPPTGPEARVFTKEEKSRAEFLLWAVSEKGKAAIRLMRKKAVELYEAGEKRIASNSLSELIRNKLKSRHPNDWRPWFGDLMVYLEPILEDFIQRKSRKQPPLTPEELKLIGDALT